MLFPIVSGGSVSLNAKVVASTTQPAGAENTIWVNTDTVMTSWVFAPEAPTSPSAGMVWICTAWRKDWSANLLNQNGILVRPTGAFQYIDSAWVVKEARMYVSGAWTDISFTYHPLIGGYCMPQYLDHSVSPARPLITFSSSSATRAQWTDGVGAYISTPNATNYYWHLTKPIHLDGVNQTTMTVVAKQTTNGNRYRRVGIKTSIAGISKTSNFTKSVSITSNSTFTLDISEITEGDYYIAGWVQGYYDQEYAASYGCSLTVSDIEIA